VVQEHITTVDIIVFNDAGELALQLRTAGEKSPFPGYWDFSAGGHVEPGEDIEKAAERELFEELGISGKLTFISQEHFQFPAWDPSVLRSVNASLYSMIYNGPFAIDPNEVVKVDFFTLPVIRKMIYEGEKIHPEFLAAWNKGLVNRAAELNKFT
jgi:8-oxo-dGTP pyrophosphatase MutT (NUDIX family)